jgi:signal transduction histidine kinase
MSGIDFMELFKADADFRDIPVIMQTGLADPEQIAFGIACGARYYLAKPFSGELVVSMVQAAIGDYRRLGELRSVNAEFSHSLALLRGAQFEMRTLEEARLLAHHLSQYFPQPARVITGIVEILVNAVEHGNLGLGYAAKSALLRSGDWTAEISRRLAMPEYRDRRVHVDLERNADRVVLTISDEGDGFDCTPYLEIQPDRVFDLHGRGIAMSRMTSFDKMEYLGRGNQVELTVMCHANGVTAPAQNAASTNAAVPQAA